MHKHATSNGTNQQQKRSQCPSIPLHVPHTENVRIHEQVAVDAREDDTRQTIAFECTARHGLTGALERN
jgi:hypothetical protein